jgi:hypothetical protein
MVLFPDEEMNLKLFIAQWFIPQSIKMAETGNLFSATAQAFGVAGPVDLETETIEALLAEYAAFTRKHAERILRDRKSQDAAKKKLFDSAFAIGARLRKELGIRNFNDVRVAARAIYRALKIDFSCENNGDVVVRKCFFSKYYSADICTLISSLDSGLVAGLSEGMTLSFSERITGNNTCCRARITR